VLSYNEAEQQVLEIVKKHTDASQIIIFAPSLPWEASMFQRPQQLARFLAKQGALVFYLQPLRSWPPVFDEVEDGLIVCQAPSDTFHVVPNAFIYALTWNIPLLAYFPSQRVIYDYLDEISVFHGEQVRLQRDHGDYLIKADLVLTTSQNLYNQAVNLRKDCVLCQNGADVDHFSKAIHPSSLPDDLRPIVEKGKPIIGYHGAMARWFDYDLLRELAQKREDLEFVLIGVDHDQSLQESQILEAKNIHWLGAKPYQELPDYLAYFNAGIIPFEVNQITNATSPIKLFEYMAAGKPVIASPMQETVRYGEFVLIASTVDEWSKQIDAALSYRLDEKKQAVLKEAASINSWAARASLILEKLAIIGASPRKLPWYWRLQSGEGRLQRLLRLVARGIKVWRMVGWRGFVKGFFYKFADQINTLRRIPFFKRPRALEETYLLEDNSQVTLYTDDDLLFGEYWPRRVLLGQRDQPEVKISLIATVYNEEGNAVEWADAILSQSLLPHEIIIVDAGSTDRTLELLKERTRDSQIHVELITEQKINIAAGRNLAIEKASHEVIVVSDFGCRPHKDWLENISAPFRLDANTEVVCGWYTAVDKQGKVVPYKGWPVLSEINPQEFIPSSRSVAFTKSAWMRAGGYPEWLTLTGEDTYFALELKRYASRWAFVPSAVVDWMAPTSLSELWQKAYSWSIGNGEAGIQSSLYLHVAKQLILGLLMLIAALLSFGALLIYLPKNQEWMAWSAALVFALVLMTASKKLRTQLLSSQWIETLGLRIAQAGGFLKGASRKDAIDAKRLAKTKGLIFLLCGTPIDDTGGGARTTQLALEFLRQGYWVVYINRYPKWEHQQAVVHIAHPNLLVSELSRFYWIDFSAKYEQLLVNMDIQCIVELPTQDFLPLMQTIKQNGGRLVYEMIDDWDSSLGGEWYTPNVEQEIIRISDRLIATAPILQTKMEKGKQSPRWHDAECGQQPPLQPSSSI
jgi:teichuronic acid biosynthesis glycosyltransferase TuaH